MTGSRQWNTGMADLDGFTSTPTTNCIPLPANSNSDEPNPHGHGHCNSYGNGTTQRYA